ncbi:hypothetical protein FHU36_003715 [Nonomuraea muscovyensis]|uniref:Uncharacterized protein n=1 Tax=Nonomuraea muscovyensis TaxID=1124761 RepID=A0A7X0C270_9ACTN|nr:hypothetical protein [Nonomuraea muscovyensis]
MRELILFVVVRQVPSATPVERRHVNDGHLATPDLGLAA